MSLKSVAVKPNKNVINGRKNKPKRKRIYLLLIFSSHPQESRKLGKDL